jgi:uncharacterized protein (TIGR03084 family)
MAGPGNDTGTGTGASTGRELIASLVGDLRAESATLRAVLASLAADDWARPTPADGWTVTDQVTHLAYFDDVTRLSVTDPERFQADADQLVAGGTDFPDRVAAQYRGTPPAELLTWFDRSRAELTQTFLAADPAVRLPWFGPPMSLASSVTARIMETWAHGQDVLDTFGIDRVPTARLRHVADIGIRALRYSYAVRGLDLPADPIRVELTAPDGPAWTWGPDEARDRVAGDALDFCLVVTQRRHRDDTGLQVTGPAATHWISIAQAFAGAAGPGRPPGHVKSPAVSPAPTPDLTSAPAAPNTSAPGGH